MAGTAILILAIVIALILLAGFIGFAFLPQTYPEDGSD